MLRIFVMLLAAILPRTVEIRGAGYMQVRNITNTEYDGGPQNWAAVQDSVGRMYFGNRDGMLAFDGERWHKYHLPNKSAVRSLLYDRNTERIYAGGSEEFGYFQPDPSTGILSYHSLSRSIKEKGSGLTEIWKIFKVDKEIYFQSDYHLGRYDGRRITIIPSEHRISTSGCIDGRIYLGFENGGISRLADWKLMPLPGLEKLAGKKIVALLPYPGGSILIATPLDGIFRYDNATASPLDSDINGFVSDNQLFCAITNGTDYVFGTVTHGAIVKNFATGATSYINKQTGMQNNTVLNAAFDKSGNIWLCLDNGLDYALHNSPVTNLIVPYNDVGAGYATFRTGDRIYFGTNQGLYSTSYPFANTPDPIDLHKELQGQIWSLTPAGSTFFVSGDAGAFVRNGSGFYRIAGLPGVYKVSVSVERPYLAIASAYDGFHLLRNVDGTWTHVTRMTGDNSGIRGNFVQDRHGNLWVSHWLKGVYMLRPSPDHTFFTFIKHFHNRNGLPLSTDNTVITCNGIPVIRSGNHLFTYSERARQIVPASDMERLFGTRDIGALFCDHAGFMAMFGLKGIHTSFHDSEGKLGMNYTPIIALNARIINGFEHACETDDGEILVANRTGFWLVNPLKTPLSGWHPEPFVSQVFVNGDSLVFRAGLSETQQGRLRLPFALNSLRIDFAYPEYYSPKSVLFSSRLENYDTDWSPWSEVSVREYTRLSEGSYTLRLRVMDPIDGKIRESTFAIRILPPWYRSGIAFTIYILLAFGLFVLGFILVRRWKENAEKEMERKKEAELESLRRQSEREALQKDYEIATLKSEQLEVDIKHKSGELSSATMNLIRKNEILNELASRISKIQNEQQLSPSVQKQLSQLQTSIRDNISHDDVWNEFNRNFDIVYVNYTKRLRETFPQLTPADIRLCCYIKMGLSSKEIAPLINISFKSVEMARYRLRKKMGISSETPLSDYLADF